MDIWDMLLGTDPDAVRQAAQPAQQMMGVNRGMQVLGAAAGPTAAGIGNVLGQQAQEDQQAMEKAAAARYEQTGPLAQSKAALERAQAQAAGQEWEPIRDWMGNTKALFNKRTAEFRPVQVGGGGGGGGMDAVTVGLAKQLHDTGQLTNVGMGKFGEARRQQIFRAYNQMYAGEDPDFASAAVSYKAGVKTAGTLAPLVAKLDAAESTAGANLDNFIKASSKLRDTGSPFFNKPLYAFQNATGDTEVAAMRTAQAVAAPEVARVLMQLGSGGQLAEKSQEGISQLLDPNATIAQKLAIATQIRQDFKARRDAYHSELNSILSNKGLPTGNTASVSGTKVRKWNPATRDFE